MVCKNCETCEYEGCSPTKKPCNSCSMLQGDQYFLLWEPKTDCKLKNKEEKKMDNRKTKAQLMEELEQKNSEIAALKKELERSANYEQYLDAAKEMRSMVDAFVESGFTEEQAIAIVTDVIGQAARQRIIR